MMRVAFWLIAVVFWCGVPSPSPAAVREAVLPKVERYLQSLTTLRADFVQIAPGGDLASGSFMLKRPGRMRWQYDPPVPVLMVSAGNYLRYYDYELNQISDIPLEDTLAGFLARDVIRFDPAVVTVLMAEAHHGVVRVKIVQKNKPKDGSLLMEFSETPLKLRNLVLVDAEGKQTSISLNNAEYGVKLPDSLFVIKDSRITRNKPRGR
jgi:outer membrane lipoprotein-sorting protein